MLRSLILLMLAATPASAAERTFMLTEFDRIRVEGPFEVRVVAAGQRGARAKGDQNAIDRIELRQQGMTLVVTIANGEWHEWQDGGAHAVVTIVAPQLRAAVVQGGGRLSVERMRGQKIDLSVAGTGMLRVERAEADEIAATLLGTGSLQVAGRAARARFTSNGTGTIEASQLAVRDLTVNSQSIGDGDYNALNTAQVTAAGLGAVRVTGPAACIVSGYGPVSCAGAIKRR